MAAQIPTNAQWWSTGSGRIELAITMDDAHCGYHQGACDDDVESLCCVPYIAEQLARIDSWRLCEELKEYGAWDGDELADHDQNLRRVLWLACGDLCDQQTEEE